MGLGGAGDNTRFLDTWRDEVEEVVDGVQGVTSVSVSSRKARTPVKTWVVNPRRAPINTPGDRISPATRVDRLEKHWKLVPMIAAVPQKM